MRSGYDLVEPHLRDALARGARVRILTGDYLDATDPDALRLLLDLEPPGEGSGTIERRVFECGPARSFHPKA